MLTGMTEDDWATVLRVFAASCSRRGAKGRNDRRFLEAFQLRHDHRSLVLPSGREGLGELRAAVQGIGALAGLRFGEPGGNLDPLSSGKPLDGLALRIQAEPALALLCGADPDVSDGLFHRVPLAWSAPQRPP
jgi:hypothetical protein